MRQNNHPGTCSCGVSVAPRVGFIYKRNGRWSVTCPSTACVKAAGLRVEPTVLDADGRLRFPYSAAAVAVVKGLPYKARKWDSAKRCWDVSAGLANPRFRALVLEVAERIGAEVADCWGESVDDDDTDDRVAAAVARAQAGAGGKVAFDFQLDGVRWLASHSRALMADDMGLGKTAQTLWALPEGARCLVVCPASLKLNWANEVRQWRSDLTARVVNGRQRDAASILPAEGEVVVVNYDILPSPKSISAADWSGVTLVTDEAHSVKSYKAARSKKVKALAPRCERVWAITGTPLLGRPTDLWGVLSAHDMEGDVFGSWASFTALFRGYKNGWGGWEWGTPKADAPALLRRVMIRRKKEDVWADMPSRRYQQILVDLDGYEEYLDEVYDAHADDLDKGALPAFSEISAVRADLARQRIPALIEQVESFEEAGEPVVVFSAYRAPVEACAAREGWAVITGDTSQADRQAAVEAFQSGRLKGIAGTIGAMGVGLTLTRASTMIFCDLDWTPALNRQAEDRICRLGQSAASCRYITLVSNHPLDLRVQAVLEQKAALVQAAVEDEGALTRVQPAAVALVEESDEARLARVAAYEATLRAAAEAKANRAALRLRWDDLTEAGRRRRAKKIVKERAGAWADSYGRRRGQVDVVVGDGERALLRAALAEMLGRCDGAATRDGEGFSKADVLVSRLLAYSPEWSDHAALAAWSLLRGYRRQLGDSYPEFWQARLVGEE